MGQGAYSSDLRSRVVAEVAAGTSRRQAARLYRVSASSAVRWAELHDETGSVSPRPRGGKSRSPLQPHRDWLLKLVAEEPDLTLRELEQRILRNLRSHRSHRSHDPSRHHREQRACHRIGLEHGLDGLLTVPAVGPLHTVP